MRDSIFNDERVQLVCKEYCLSNNSKPFEALHTSIYMSFTWEQFNKYQSKHTCLWFFSEKEFLEITKSKRMLKKFHALQAEALKYYLSFYEGALRDSKELA